LPRTEQEMDDYIAGLTNQISAKLKQLGGGPGPKTDSEEEELLKKLMYTCSPKIVPALLRTMYGTLTEPASYGFWENEALLFYVPRTEEVRKAIIDTVTRHNAANQSFLLLQYGFPREELKPLIENLLAPGNSNNWAAGASLATKYGDDAFTARLIALTSEGDT